MMDQGWLLVLLTSLTTFCGCCIIFADAIYKLIFPRLYAKHPFNISDNSTFLISSLALSSGCLLFSSLFKLLPEGKEYISHMKKFRDGKNARLFSFYYLSSYLIGILICGLLNMTVHYFTSESIVHCVHDHDDHSRHKSHSHSHTHTQSSPDNEHSHSHAHREVDPSSSSLSDIEGKQIDKHTKKGRAHSNGSLNSLDHEPHNEITPLLAAQKKISSVDLSLQKINGTVFHGICNGFDPLDKCCIIEDHHYHSDSPSITHSHDRIHRLSQGSQVSKSLKGPNIPSHTVTHDSFLHYCDLPVSENILFFDDTTKKLIKSKKQMSRTHSELHVFSPLMTVDDSVSSTIHPSNDPELHNNSHIENIIHTSGHIHDHTHQHDHSNFSVHQNSISDLRYHDDTEYQNDHKHHHHRINTPLSRLLSIGVQTVLAITLHKLPEGFIMYSTSQADPKLGLTIFMSMFIHNFVEGFTMTLPIYIALNSRLKALLISGLLGALAQPLGALLGYFMFRNNSLDMNLDANNLLFGSLISMTSGFLTIIALQMFASSIAFGGKQGYVLTCTCIGIFLISISLILVDDSQDDVALLIIQGL